MDSLVVDAKIVESLLQVFFEVSPTTLRAHEFYRERINAYVYPEGLSSVYVEVTQAVRDGDWLTLYYQYPSNMQLGIVSRTGVLTVELDGDRFRYLSHQGEQTLGVRLIHPSGIGAQWTDSGIVMYTHGGIIGLYNDDGTYVEYSGTDLGDIAAFYEQTLHEIGATGQAQPDVQNDSWSWTGVTPDGIPLDIRITPRKITSPGMEDHTYTIHIDGEAILELQGSYPE